MSTSLSGASGNQKTLKCRKCRHLLLEEPPNKILETVAIVDDQDSSNIYNICDDTLPQWISEAVEEVGRNYQNRQTE